jgi:hypothetical protein
MFGEIKLRDKLINDAGVLASVDTYIDASQNVLPAIWKSMVVPSSFDESGKSINYYLNQPTDGGLEYGNYTYTINCRALTEGLAEVIQRAVYTALNRLKSDVGRGFFRCSMRPPIPPADKTDNYNAIVEVLIRD